MKKTYILDTNVLVHSPYSIFAFDEHDVVIVDVTLEELDRLKTQPGDLGANARAVNRILDELRAQGSIVSGIKLPGGGMFHVENNHVDIKLPEGWEEGKADNRILRVAKALKDNGNAILITKDISMRLKADIVGVQAQDYKAEQVASDDEQYTGRVDAYVAGAIIDEFYKYGRVKAKNLYQVGEDGASIRVDLETNQFVRMINETNPKQTALARFDGNEIVPLVHAGKNPFGVSPRNVGQKFAQECLLASVDVAPLVILKGPAGTAKTFYTMAAALAQVVDEKAYEKILIARPNIGFDEGIGFLPGTEEDKIMPLIRPVIDNLDILMKTDKKTHSKDGCTMQPWKYLIDSGIITAQAMTFLRGRSISDTFIFLDECQNMTPIQALGVVTRVNLGSKLVMCGDINQIDNPRLDTRTNGLSYISEKMKGSPLCWQVSFTEQECTRSALAAEAIERMKPKGFINW